MCVCVGGGGGGVGVGGGEDYLKMLSALIFTQPAKVSEYYSGMDAHSG